MQHSAKSFVTGGAGFIGSHLVDELVKSGEVTIFDNLSSGKKSFIESHLNSGRAKLIKGDLLDLESLSKEISGHDIVFHLAANPDARLGIEDTRLDLEQETIATYNVLEAMRLNRIFKIVFASSGTVYGETPVVPLSETWGPLLPISLYGAGKLASEGLISAYSGTFDIRAWIFRFANIVGSRATHGAIFDFIRKLENDSKELEILGNGLQSKPYLHVQDCIRGILHGFQRSGERVNLFNIGCDTATDVTTIAKILIDEMDLKEVTIKYSGGERGWRGDVPQVRFDVKKIASLGWSAKYSSDEAVRQAIRDILKIRAGDGVNGKTI